MQSPFFHDPRDTLFRNLKLIARALFYICQPSGKPLASPRLGLAEVTIRLGVRVVERGLEEPLVGGTHPRIRASDC